MSEKAKTEHHDRKYCIKIPGMTIDDGSFWADLGVVYPKADYGTMLAVQMAYKKHRAALNDDLMKLGIALGEARGFGPQIKAAVDVLSEE